jgi:hypothetical protein
MTPLGVVRILLVRFLLLVTVFVLRLALLLLGVSHPAPPSTGWSPARASKGDLPSYTGYGKEARTPPICVPAVQFLLISDL